MGRGGVPTLGATRLRVVTAVGALALACALGLLPAAYGGDRGRLLLVLGAVGVVATATALAGRAAATWWAVGVLGARYAVFVFGRGAVDVRAPVVGAGLLVLAELVHWSLSAGSSVGDETGMTARHLADLAVLWLGSLVLGSVVVAPGVIGVPGGVLVAIVGVVGASSALGLVAVLVRDRGAASVPRSGGGDREER